MILNQNDTRKPYWTKNNGREFFQLSHPVQIKQGRDPQANRQKCRRTGNPLNKGRPDISPSRN